MFQLPAARQQPEALATLKARGRLRVVWLALGLAGAAGCVALGIYEETPESPHEWWWLPLFLLLAAVSVVLAVRSFGRGVDADGNGVTVRNTLRARPIPWSDLAAIEFKGVDSEAISNMYYQLVFQRHDGSRVTAEAPGGGIEPGDYLFELRQRLLAMRSAALGDPHPPADRPSETGGTDEEAAPPAEPPSWPAPPRLDSTDTEDDPPAPSTWSRVKRWAGLIAGVTVILAINFAPIPSLGLLLWHAGRILHVDVMPQQIYWEDLQPGMCVNEDPNEMDYQVVDCNAEHEEEVMLRGTIAGIAEWPGDAAVEAAALEKCTPAFASYVGKNFDDSRLDFNFLTPEEEGWSDGKVTLICLVLDPDHHRITRSLRNAHE